MCACVRVTTEENKKEAATDLKANAGAAARSYNINLTSFPCYPALDLNISGLVENKDGDESGVQSTKTAAVY